MSHLLADEVANAVDLKAKLREIGFEQEHSIAVEALIFDPQDRWLLMRRGGQAQDEVGKFEGVGGSVEGSARFRDELRREIREEIGALARVEIAGFLEVKSDLVEKRLEDGRRRQKTWIISSYVCLHAAGDLVIAEPEKNNGFIYVENLDVEPGLLSSSCQQSLDTLRERWPEVSGMLAKAKEATLCT